MVLVECGSCSNTVELDDGEYGTFECPYCQSDIHIEDPNEEYNDGFNVGVVLVFFLVFSVALIALISASLGNSGWEETQGEITSRDYSNSLDIAYYYTFEVNGETYSGNDGWMCPDNYNCRTFSEGDLVTISYDPFNPNKNEILDDSFSLGILICCGSIPVLILGAILFARVMYGKKIISSVGYDNPS